MPGGVSNTEIPRRVLLGNLPRAPTLTTGVGKEGGSNPTPVATTHWLRATTPSGLRVTDLYLAIYPAMIKVPVDTYLLRGCFSIHRGAEKNPSRKTNIRTPAYLYGTGAYASGLVKPAS